MKPIIGVTPLWDDKLSSIWMLPAYMDAIRESGAIPIIFPLEATAEDTIQLCEICSGFLLTGGHDISPSLYEQQATHMCGTTNLHRDSLEAIVFDYAVERDLPLLGICRGIQIINALCGGTLYQDLPSEYDHPKAIDHVNHQMEPPYDKPCHKVSLIEGTPLALLAGCSEMGVNSYHHQAIRELSPKLKAMALSEDGLVEAVYMPDKRFIEAVQWHPEFDFHCNEVSRRLFGALHTECATVSLNK